MSDHDIDIVAWSEQQADALRRRSFNEIDWDNIIEEIESVGRSETDAVESLLANAINHKLKLLGWPDNISANHWRAEIRAWLQQAARKHRASMHIDIADVFEMAIARLDVAMLDLPPPDVPLPAEGAGCPWTLEQLIEEGKALRRR